MFQKKHILFLTWKDIRHPYKGGAELVMYEYARGLVQKGHKVTWFASYSKGLTKEETIDGIKIIRRFTYNTIWVFAWIWYRKYKRNNTIDVIVDEAGGWPLLSPLYEKNIPIFFFTHHIGDKEFDQNANFSFLSPLVRWTAKKVYMKLFQVYKKTRTLTISESTKKELVNFFSYSPDNIHVVSITTNIDPIEKIDWAKKTDNILFLGRITSIKGTIDAVRAFAYVREKLPKDSKLSIIGNDQDAAYVKKLRECILELDITDHVIFHGFINREDFPKAIASHQCILVPSEKEGFGLIVLEANAYGLPAIAYDVGGLRDSVYPGVNGILVPFGNYKKMGEKIIEVFGDRNLAESSLAHVKSIPKWNENIDTFEQIILPTKQ